MYLKSLTLHGFKSFADKTHLEFATGVTGIVGPNGCGKSNVVDAIRWVLGETSAKALRGDEMADVIFNGTDKRKPVGMAEVTLTMADCEQALKVDYNEVSLTRRVFRDGRSEYRLNGTLCRLKDFHELLAGTGIGRAAYSIMAQGQIDMLLSSKPEDRRSVFEEAAGITKFKSQKREALRKLEYTEANLLRVADIVAEVKRQMGSLQRQAQKAKRYQGLLQDVRTLDTHLGYKHYVELTAEKTGTENKIRDLMLALNDAHRQLHATEAEATRTREEYHTIESTIGQLRQQSQELRSQLQGAESRIGFNRERIEELNGRIRRNEEDIANSRDMLDQHEREMADADEQLHMIRSNIESRMTDLNMHQSGVQSLIPQRQAIDNERRTIRESLRQFEGQAAGSEGRVQSLTIQLSADRQRHEMLAHDKQLAAQARETAQVEFDELQRQITELEYTRNELDEKLKQCARAIVDKRQQRDAQEAEFNDLQRTTTQRRSRLEVIRQLIEKGEGLEQGTQQVLKGLDNPEVFLTGMRGLLASHIEVMPEFIGVIEAALREHLHSVLLANSDLASQIIDRLTSHKLGRVAVVAQDLIASRPPPLRPALPDGAIAWATDKVTAKEGAQKLVDTLLGHVVIAEDLQTALLIKHSHPFLAIVTLGGEFISTEGVIQGGATKEEAASTLRRESEVRDLAAEVESLETRLRDKEHALLQLRQELDDTLREETQLREQSQRTREGLSQHQGKISVVQRELQQAASKAESIDWDQSQISDRMASAEQQMAQLRDTITLAYEQLNTARAREAELEVEADAMARRELEASERLNELRTALALEQSSLQSVERQKAPLAARLNELLAGIQRFDHEIITWRERIITAQSESEQLALASEEGRTRLAEIEEQGAETLDRRAAAFERVTQLETQLVTLRQQNTEMSEQRSRAEVQLTRVDLRLENLISQIQDRYQMAMDSFVPDRAALAEAIEFQKNPRLREKRREALAGAGVEVVELPPEDVEAANEAAPVADDSEVVFMADDVVTIDAGETEDWKTEDTRPEDPKQESTVDSNVFEASAFDWDYVTEVVTELRQRLEGIGPVNLDAIQEFEELEQRHNFLESQHSDLVKSKAELLEVIAKINETTKNMFVETFNLVKGYFAENFRELFGASAQADLLLVDENDPLETGIDIIAKPPGKKLQTISLLSGGERSMTAVALLFSIYQVKPSPFCVLDELDAPLDESNISRFLKMLDKFIDNSQFIIVTHNKRTMSRADVIYGVTMQEFGVSKPVGVRMTSEADVKDFSRQRGIGKVVEGDPLLPEELQPKERAKAKAPGKGGRKSKAKAAAEEPTEFAALEVDSEQAQAQAVAPEEDVVVFVAEEEHSDGVGLSA